MWGRGQSSLKVLQDVFPAGLYDRPHFNPVALEQAPSDPDADKASLATQRHGLQDPGGGPTLPARTAPQLGRPQGYRPRGESLEYSDSDKVA